MLKRIVNASKGRAGRRYAVIGANGQLGTDLVRTFDLPGELVPLTHADIEVTDPHKTREVLSALKPDCVLNTAAYNKVDAAEDAASYEDALNLNGRAVGGLARVCEELRAELVHFSTDYVFDGKKGAPYVETDAVGPINRYGASKLAGERLAEEGCERTFIFRVSGLFGVATSSGKGGVNFVETMLRLAREGKPLRVVSDVVSSPSYTLDLARKVWRVLPTGAYDLYHLVNAGETSWHDFAREIFRQAGLSPDLKPVTAAEYGAKAPRPARTSLARANLAALGQDDLRPWNEALSDYLKERGAKAK